MKTYLYVAIVLFLVVDIPIMATAQQNNPYAENVVVFKLKADSKSAIVNQNIHSPGLKSLFESAGLIQLHSMFPHAQSPEKARNSMGQAYVDLSLIFVATVQVDIFPLIAKLQQTDIIEYAQPYYIPQLLFEPDDPMHSQQYHLALISAYQAWDVHMGSDEIVIGIIDTGTDIDHPDLIYQIAYNHNDPIDGIDNDGDGYIDNFRGWDLGENDNNPQADMSKHGTWVSGLSSAQVNNATGIAGTGFRCKFLPIKISDNNNVLTKAYEGIVYAADHGCKVINCSWGSEYWNPLGQDIVDYAVINRDALVIAACGNTNSLGSFYPASFERVLSVAATTSLDEKWTPDNTGTTAGSTYGYQVDISAPGALLYSTDDGGGYMIAYGGTSFAAPVVAGAAAILRSYYPELSALQIAELLKQSSDNIDTIAYNAPYAGLLGTGRLNMYDALIAELTPAISLENIAITDDRDDYYQNSLLVSVHADLINYLAYAENLTLQVSCNSPYVQLLNPNINIGNVSSLETIALEQNAITFFIDENIDYNETVVLRIDFVANNYEAYQYIEVFLKPSFKNISTKNILLSVPANGRLGFHDGERYAGRGMDYKNYIDLFYDCGLMIAEPGGKTHTAVRQEPDFEVLQYPRFVDPPSLGNLHVQSMMNDSRDIQPSQLLITQNAYSWHDDINSDFVIIEYVLKNDGLEELNNYYAGLFADFDLVMPAQNKASYDEQTRMMFTEYTGQQTLYAGMMLLSLQHENHYALEQIEGGDGFIDLTNGFINSEKFYMLSNSRDEAGIAGTGTDVVTCVSAGPITIAPGDSVSVVFALLASESIYTMKLAALQARNMYDSLMNPALVDNYHIKPPELFPNPANNYVIVQHNFSDETCEFDLYDLLGRKILTGLISENPAVVELQTIENDGMYVFVLKNRQQQVRGLLQIVR